jgi:hypothetical protein
VACGDNHSLFLSELGSVLACGEACFGALGLPKTMVPLKSPQTNHSRRMDGGRGSGLTYARAVRDGKARCISEAQNIPNSDFVDISTPMRHVGINLLSTLFYHIYVCSGSTSRLSQLQFQICLLLATK